MSRARRSDFKGCDVCKKPERAAAGLCRSCARIARVDLEFVSKHGLRRCSFPDCERLGEYSIAGVDGHWCWPHRRQLRNGEALTPASSPKYFGKTCTYPGCKRDSMLTFPICRYHKKIAGRYGLGPIELTDLVAKGGGSCEACGDTDEYLYIDHDHACCNVQYGACGKCVRGLLCRGCNFAAGFAKDNPRRLEAIAGYLRLGGYAEG